MGFYEYWQTYDEYMREVNTNIVENFKNMYNYSNTFECATLSRGKVYYSKNSPIYKFDIKSIFTKCAVDEHNEIVDRVTLGIHTMLYRTYKEIVMGIYLIEAEIESMGDEHNPIGNRGISIADRVALNCFQKIVVLSYVANDEQGFDFQDTKFRDKYNKFIKRVNNNANKEIGYIIRYLIAEYSKTGIWKANNSNRIHLKNLYNIMKHGLEASDIFEIKDREALKENFKVNKCISDKVRADEMSKEEANKYKVDLKKDLMNTQKFNETIKEILICCKKSIEDTLMIISDDADYYWSKPKETEV